MELHSNTMYCWPFEQLVNYHGPNHGQLLIMNLKVQPH